MYNFSRGAEELTDIPELDPERVAITAMLYIVFRGTGPMSGRAKRDARAAKASRRQSAPQIRNLVYDRQECIQIIIINCA